MQMAIVLTAALFAASPVFAAETGASSHGASKKAPGHQSNTAAGPGHSESAPGQRMTTTGSSTHRR